MRHFRPLLRYTAVLLLVAGLMAPAVHAAGSVPISFGDLGDDYGVGDTVAVPVVVGNGDIAAVHASFTYPQNLLQFEELDLGGDFDPSLGIGSCTQQTGGGLVAVDCTTTAEVDNPDLVALAYFTVMAPGTATFTMTSADVQDGSGTSLWDGQLASSSLTLLTAQGVATAGAGTSSSSSGGGTVHGSGASTSTGTGTGTSTAGGVAASAPTTVVSTNGKTLNLQPGKGAVLLTAVDDGGRPLLGVKVVVDGQKTGYTDNTGEFEFINLAPGPHTATATKRGRADTQATFTVEVGKEAQVKLHVNMVPPSPLLGYVSLGILVGIPVFLWLLARFPVRMQVHPREVPDSYMNNAVVGSAGVPGVKLGTGEQPAVPAQVARPAYVPPPLPVEPLPQAVLNPESLPVAPQGGPDKRRLPRR